MKPAGVKSREEVESEALPKPQRKALPKGPATPAVAPGSAAGKKGERVREMGVELWHVGNALRALRALRALLPEEGVGNGEALGGVEGGEGVP